MKLLNKHINQKKKINSKVDKKPKWDHAFITRELEGDSTMYIIKPPFDTYHIYLEISIHYNKRIAKNNKFNINNSCNNNSNYNNNNNNNIKKNMI